MLSFVACAPLLQAAYTFPVDRKLPYDLTVTLDGHLPLFGGSKGVASVLMAVEVGGLLPDAEGNPRAYSDLKDFKISFNGAALPFTVENVRAYFPKTTISHSRFGRVLKTDAPDTQLPVRLPGLDAKRFPEISYLPIELPESELQVGKSWAFKRTFAGSELGYVVTPRKATEAAVEMDVRLEQATQTLENSAGDTVADPKEAARRVETTVSGTGAVVFSPALGLAPKVDVELSATSKVTELADGAISVRTLKTTLKVRLREPGAAPPAIRPRERFPFGWRIPDFATAAASQSDVVWQVLHRALGLEKAPGR